MFLSTVAVDTLIPFPWPFSVLPQLQLPPSLLQLGLMLALGVKTLVGTVPLFFQRTRVHTALVCSAALFLSPLISSLSRILSSLLPCPFTLRPPTHCAAVFANVDVVSQF